MFAFQFLYFKEKEIAQFTLAGYSSEKCFGLTHTVSNMYMF